MTCSNRDKCNDIDSLKTIGNAMKRKLDDQDAELRRQMMRISSLEDALEFGISLKDILEDMLEAERRVCWLMSTVAAIELLVIVIAFACAVAGGPVA